MTVLALGGSKDSVLIAISTTPSFNYTSHKKDAVAGYTLTQIIDNAVDTATHTTFNGQPAYLLEQTTQPNCKGDEAGRGGGVKSGTIGGEVKPTSGSTSVFIGGKALVREDDSCTMNFENVEGSYVFASASKNTDAFFLAVENEQNSQRDLELLAGLGGNANCNLMGMDSYDSAASLAKWSRDQGHTPLETQRLLSEFNTGRHYSAKLRPLSSTEKPNNPLGNEEMFGHYLYGRGQPLTLDNLGSTQLIKNTVLKEGAFDRQGSIQDRFIHNDLIRKFEEGDSDYTFKSGYDIGKEIGIWAYGGGVISGEFHGSMEENASGDIKVSGRIDYKYTDEFKDPYDLFNSFEGSWDPNGTPYNVSGEWTNYVNTTVKKPD